MSSQQLQITVKQANKREGEFYSSGYIDYSISTISNHPAFPPGYFIIERRYSDFVWLREELGETYPGVIIPSLPEKQIMGNFEQSFIESRKRGLQKFLNRVAMHPLLIEARQFVKFLTANEDAFSMERLATEQKKQTVLKDTFVSWWDKSYYSVMDTVSGVKPIEVVTVQTLSIDPDIDSISQHLDRLDGYTQKLILTSQQKLDGTAKLAKAYEDFGLAFSGLSGKEQGLTAASFGQIGKRAETIGKNGNDLKVGENDLFFDLLKEYERQLQSAKECLSRRNAKKEAYITAVNNLNLISARDDEKDPSKKQELVSSAQKSVETSKSEYEQISSLFLTEFTKFKQESSIELKDALFKFVQLQVEYHKKTGDVWTKYEDHQYVAVPTGADNSNCNIS